MRTPVSVERLPRLPVWPAWQGIAIGALGLFSRPAADALEAAYGGRVCPMPLTDASDPFILLVHHRHSFKRFDPLRPLFSKLVMPEGFPAHPHRGFETVTYVLPGRGGLVHRDSRGTKVRYADGACQWMTAGSGMLHEEMWDVDSEYEEHELYQLWLNLPPAKKLAEPTMQLLHGSGEGVAEVLREGRMGVRLGPIPRVELDGGRVVVRQLCGDGVGAETQSDVRVEHVTLAPGARYAADIRDGWTCLLYVRKGRIDCGGGALADTYELATMGRRDVVQLTNVHDKESDVLLLAGAPIGAPVVAQGPMVMNSPAEVDEAMRDYSRGLFGLPWEHTATDDQWVQTCETSNRA